MLVPRPKPLATQNDSAPVARATRTSELVMRRESYSGPVAHPAIAQGWESVVPGSADRILGMAEGQAKHRQYIEKWSVISRSIALPLGAIIGGALGLGAMYAGYSLVMADKPISGFAFMVTGLGPLVWAYFKKANQDKK